jgi:hypothetical protein
MLMMLSFYEGENRNVSRGFSALPVSSLQSQVSVSVSGLNILLKFETWELET